MSRRPITSGMKIILDWLRTWKDSCVVKRKGQFYLHRPGNFVAIKPHSPRSLIRRNLITINPSAKGEEYILTIGGRDAVEGRAG